MAGQEPPPPEEWTSGGDDGPTAPAPDVHAAGTDDDADVGKPAEQH